MVTFISFDYNSHFIVFNQLTLICNTPNFHWCYMPLSDMPDTGKKTMLAPAIDARVQRKDGANEGHWLKGFEDSKFIGIGHVKSGA